MRAHEDYWQRYIPVGSSSRRSAIEDPANVESDGSAVTVPQPSLLQVQELEHPEDVSAASTTELEDGRDSSNLESEPATVTISAELEFELFEADELQDASDQTEHQPSSPVEIVEAEDLGRPVTPKHQIVPDNLSRPVTPEGRSVPFILDTHPIQVPLDGTSVSYCSSDDGEDIEYIFLDGLLGSSEDATPLVTEITIADDGSITVRHVEEENNDVFA